MDSKTQQNPDLNKNLPKTALITGANKGIGFETARQLLQQGFFVYLGSRDIERGARAIQQLQAIGLINVKAIAIDVTKLETVAKAREIIEQERGRLDVLINNAGISGVVPQSALETPADNYREVLEVNLYGVVNVTQAFIPLLKQSFSPRIVNVSTSVGSLTLQSDPQWPAYDYAKYAVYAASKSAMNMYTVHLAYELRDTAIKVNAICPGYTKTDFTGHIGGEVENAGKRIVKYALIDENGPSGKFFAEETNPDSGEVPW
ncbi:SDR family oxidoreductase [Fulvivirga ligni]|uniref:SDR family oxidoreductase n=1 Tax=Fulvivirga ligni TaxID=2904246 RepID=UPI001F174B25|nr:SDR family oxidoreductase [Fulvivirga ligni]UII24282.1 SDR family oxidoreductase [Fulvivirga ligni]